MVDTTYVVPVGPGRAELVYEFLDAFQGDLSRLPLHKEIEW